MKKKVLFLAFIILTSSFTQVLQCVTYTVTNLSKYPVWVSWRQPTAFNDWETKLLEPQPKNNTGIGYMQINTNLLNCIDSIKVRALDPKTNKIISPFPYEQNAVCAGSNTLCIVNGRNPNPVEIYTAWSGSTPEQCAAGR
ncbi:MAG: hypothetical protein K2X90_00145 [Candidatus Babeliaceae bacterium]|nr:hypothetical protein [Candidatus Babeliaceae bacterium]